MTQFIGLDDLRQWLIEQGFKIEKAYLNSKENECNWNAYRRSKIPARNCECNYDKDGMQIIIKPHVFTINGIMAEGVEFEVCGEYSDTWFKLMAYSIKPDEVESKLDEIERSLISAWNALTCEIDGLNDEESDDEYPDW